MLQCYSLVFPLPTSSELHLHGCQLSKFSSRYVRFRTIYAVTSVFKLTSLTNQMLVRRHGNRHSFHVVPTKAEIKQKLDGRGGGGRKQIARGISESGVALDPRVRVFRNYMKVWLSQPLFFSFLLCAALPLLRLGPFSF